MIDRRSFMALAAGAGTLAVTPALARQSAIFGGARLREALRGIESESRGRLGVAVIDKATGARFAWRGDERFPMASTFKFPLAAATLHRVDRGLERLDRPIAVRAADIVAFSPVTERLVGRTATVAQLCEATLTTSDNAAANLLLAPLGGPAGFTAFMRAAGDPVTRLDRREPEMNRVAGADPRDTSSPSAMAGALDLFLTGGLLRPATRDRLLAWMFANRTGGNRIRAGVPAGWRVADKTGTSGSGQFADVGLIAPPRRAPLLLSVYLAESDLAWREGERAIERATRAVIAEL